MLLESTNAHILQHRCPHLEREQQQESLHAVEASVHKVPHEEIVGLRAVPSHFEQLHQIKELAMDISACRMISHDEESIKLLTVLRK